MKEEILINKDQKEEQMITEYVETGEGTGISVIPMKKKGKNIDEKNLIIDNIDDSKIILS